MVRLLPNGAEMQPIVVNVVCIWNGNQAITRVEMKMGMSKSSLRMWIGKNTGLLEDVQELSKYQVQRMELSVHVQIYLANLRLPLPVSHVGAQNLACQIHLSHSY